MTNLSTKTVEELWEEGVPHDPRSELLARSLAKLDEQNGDVLCLKFGGDGDNGEHLLYLMDIYFQEVMSHSDDELARRLANARNEALEEAASQWELVHGFDKHCIAAFLRGRKDQKPT